MGLLSGKFARATHVMPNTSLLFAELPADVVRAIFEHLEDNDILPLLQLGRIPRIISLVTLITRYRSRFDFEHHISFSSSSHDSLYANLMSITKLTCRAPPLLNIRNHITDSEVTPILQRVIAALPNVLEAYIIYDIPSTGRPSPHSVLNCSRGFPFIVAVLGHAPAPPNVHVIDASCAPWLHWTSKRRRFHKHVYIKSSYDSLPRWIRIIGYRILQLWFAAGWVHSFFGDPFARKEQCRRVRFDLQAQLRTPRSTQIIPFDDWTLVIFDADTVTELNITPSQKRSVIPLEQTHLLALHYSILTSLTIDECARITMSTLLQFLARHPTVRSLVLKHSTIHGIPNPTTTPLLPHSIHLDTVSAPLHIFAHLLPYIDAQSLHTAQIGCLGTPPRLEKFDFSQLDHILRVLATAGKSHLKIFHVWLPGGRAAEPWLHNATSTQGLEEEERPERRLVRVRRVVVHAENPRVEPFDESIKPLFAEWFKLFPALMISRVEGEGYSVKLSVSVT
ncbi:hypothetical protein Hypma_002085 [Hypsizygus marmoreus]|uniref:F-box domain-containing protein n=1 Tax=Hypsizygus marmoreus TaxID=39966 RepID=A0A369K7U3_HYPMA|nr:hypothetical protein Hypma_002085 [Hypsizygus marmoreus]